MLKKVIIDDVSPKLRKKEFNAGPKARKDINTILEDYKKAYFIETKNLLLQVMHGIWLSIKYRNYDIIVIQYPYYLIKQIYLKMIHRLFKNKQTILLIHDIDTLRYGLNKERIQEEIDVINHFKIVISHNEKMSQWLKDNGCQSPIINMELFDYLCEDNSSTPPHTKKVFARMKFLLQEIFQEKKVYFFITISGTKAISV